MAFVRKLWALVASVALQAAALSAPLVHEHPDEQATDHHHGRAVHMHWAGHAHDRHPAEGPALTDADHDRSVFLNSFVAIKSAASPAPAGIFATDELPAPAERRPYRAIDIVRSHDPPIAESRSSRAPPSFLS